MPSLPTGARHQRGGIEISQADTVWPSHPTGHIVRSCRRRSSGEQKRQIRHGHGIAASRSAGSAAGGTVRQRRGCRPCAVAVVIVAGCASRPGSVGCGRPDQGQARPGHGAGTLVLWTDPDYAPQSMAVKGATRLASTKCPEPDDGSRDDRLRRRDGQAGRRRAGPRAVLRDRAWDQVIAGNWGDQWDVAWGSGALEAARMTALYVTQPYYTTPANFFVLASSTDTKPSDLNGKKIGACAGCSHEQYLRGTLELPGKTLSPTVANPKIVTYAYKMPGLADVADGKIDAFLCSEPVGAGAIAGGRRCACSTRLRSTRTRPATSIAA